MDYRKIITSRALRLNILNALSWVPDKTMLKLQYRIKTGRKLNLKNPQRYTEKLQWYKLYYRDPLMIQCVDKFDVREYVRSKGLENILNECYGMYDKVEDIEFDSLPDKFVLKDTLGGGGTSIIICRDKDLLDFEAAKKQMQSWIDTPSIPSGGREWQYYNGQKHRIIIEKYLRCKCDDLPDYKFFCFQGEVYCLYTMIDYTDNHENGKMGFYDRDFNKMSYRRLDFKPITNKLYKPDNFDLMLKYAMKLSEDFPHVRVDFYNIDGNIIFGEMTFFNASGYVKFEPDTFDYILGKEFNLPDPLQLIFPNN